MKNDTILRQIINELGLTQKDFATAINYSESYISKILNGKQPFTQDVKKAIHKKFNYSLESMSDESNCLKNAAVIAYECSEKIFIETDVIIKNEYDPEKLLCVTARKSLIEFLLNVVLAKKLKEQGSQCFEEEFDKFSKCYLESLKMNEDCEKYVLIPYKEAPKLIEDYFKKVETLENLTLLLKENRADKLDAPENLE